MLATAAEQSAVGLVGAQDADANLVARVRAGDHGAFATLYRRYHRPVAGYVYGMVEDHGRAEDITQEAFISALRRMQETDRPIVFRPWIYAIAKNACIDQFRRSRRKDEVSYDGEDVLEAAHGGRWVTTSPGPAAAIDRKESLDHLCGAFGGLTDAHHQILVLREFEGLSYQEIGERLGMTGAAVESTLFRARKRLAEEYGELVSGKRCLQVQALLTDSPGTALGGRDGRRVERHISHCAPCRRHARRAGLTVEVAQRRSLRTRVAAFLPLPAILRRRGEAEDAGASGLVSSQAPALSHMSASLGPIAEPLAGWVKAAVLAAAIAVAGTGAGVATKRIDVPGLSRLPVVGGSTTTKAPSHPAADTRHGPDAQAPAGVSGPAGVPRGTTTRPIAFPDGSPAPADGTATPGGSERGAAGGGTTPATSPTPASGARRGLANRNPSLGGAPPTGGGTGAGSAVPRRGEVRQDVRDSVKGVVPGGLPRRPEANRSRPLSGLKDAVPNSVPAVPKPPDPSDLLPAPDPSLPPLPTPNPPPTPDPGDPLGGGLGGLLGG